MAHSFIELWKPLHHDEAVIHELVFTHSCPVFLAPFIEDNSVQPHRRQPTRLPRPWDFPGKNTGVCQRRRCKRHRFHPWEDPLEKGMTTHSNILAWEILRMEEPGYVTTGKTIALTRRTFVGKVMSLLFSMLSRLASRISSLDWCHPEVRHEDREPLPDKAGESTILSRSGGVKGLS